MSNTFDWEDFWNLVGAGAALAVLTLILTILFKWIFADNTIRYCLIQHRSSDTKVACNVQEGYRSLSTTEWKLEGQVDWRDNQTIGYFNSYNAAIEAAKKINCPLNIDSNPHLK